MAREIDLWRDLPTVAGFPDLWNLMNEDSERNWAPRTRVEENEGHYLVGFEVPGIPKENINIEVSGNQLIVSGEKLTHAKKGDERGYRRFTRTFTLPQDVDAERIEARCENGMLELAIPKMEAAQRRRIEIGKGEGFFSKLGEKVKDKRGRGEESKADTTPRSEKAA